MKKTLANFLSDYFQFYSGQNIYFLCIVVRNPDKHNIYFISSDKARFSFSFRWSAYLIPKLSAAPLPSESYGFPLIAPSQIIRWRKKPFTDKPQEIDAKWCISFPICGH
jgi:hypothetical protein